MEFSDIEDPYGQGLSGGRVGAGNASDKGDDFAGRGTTGGDGSDYGQESLGESVFSAQSGNKEPPPFLRKTGVAKRMSIPWRLLIFALELFFQKLGELNVAVSELIGEPVLEQKDRSIVAIVLFEVGAFRRRFR